MIVFIIWRCRRCIRRPNSNIKKLKLISTVKRGLDKLKKIVEEYKKNDFNYGHRGKRRSENIAGHNLSINHV